MNLLLFFFSVFLWYVGGECGDLNHNLRYSDSTQPSEMKILVPLAPHQFTAFIPTELIESQLLVVIQSKMHGVSLSIHQVKKTKKNYLCSNYLIFLSNFNNIRLQSPNSYFIHSYLATCTK